MSADQLAGLAGRRRHYGEFYGLDRTERPGDDAPVALVFGNCQAESLRIMLDGPDLRTVRVPPVFELEPADVPHLVRLLARTSILVSQPVRDDYHDLPLGTAQLAALLPPSGRVVRMPVVRFAGLYPYHVIVRPPSDASLVPPIVEYHDLRTVMRAWAEREGRRGGAGGSGVVATHDDRERIRRIAAQSIAELQKREIHHDTVVVSDLFADPDFDLMRTMNHPGNAVWTAAAARVRDRLSLAGHVVDPGRPLLDSVHAPREESVIRAFDLDAEPRPDWTVNGRRISVGEVENAHLAWYEQHPDVIDAAMTRHHQALDTLGLLPPTRRRAGHGPCAPRVSS